VEREVSRGRSSRRGAHMRLDPASSDEGPNGEESETTVHLGMAMRQKSMQMELLLEGRGNAPRVERSGEARPAVQGDERSGINDLMERVIERENCLRALKRVRSNKGSPGIDGMTVEALPQYLREHWEEIRRQLLAGTYQPNAVRRYEIPKSGGGVRQLGIPTVLDRFLQQAILQVLQPIFDPTFSEHSYGFRPGRRAHDAVCQAQQYVQSGRRWVVDVDLEKFFDRVNHDVLMARLANRVEDKRLLRIIRRYLEAGIMADGVVVERHEGTPQGGPLSPLLANVLLDEVDRMLEGSGHRFVRYADDCNVYVRSKRAGERVMERMVKLYAKLKLRVNEEKSTVARVWERKFWATASGWPQASSSNTASRQRSWRPSSSAFERLPLGPGGNRCQWLWKSYGAMCWAGRHTSVWRTLRGSFRTLTGGSPDGCGWCNSNSGNVARHRELRRRGVPERVSRAAAAHGRSWWRTAGHGALHTAMPSRYLAGLGLPRLAPH
jgi:RNA-directed DNA polymerase